MAAGRNRTTARRRPVPGTPPARQILNLALVILLAGASAWAYSTSFAGVLVLDDVRAIARNRTIRTLWPLPGPLSPPSGTIVSGRPVANLTLAINYALAPPDAVGRAAARALRILRRREREAAPRRRRRDALAVVHLQRALAVLPDDAALLARLAAMLADSRDASVRDGARAVDLAERAVRLTARQDPWQLEILSVAQASVGRFAEAAATVNEALWLARAQRYERLISELEYRAAAYRARQ